MLVLRLELAPHLASSVAGFAVRCAPPRRAGSPHARFVDASLPLLRRAHSPSPEPNRYHRARAAAPTLAATLRLTASRARAPRRAPQFSRRRSLPPAATPAPLTRASLARRSKLCAARASSGQRPTHDDAHLPLLPHVRRPAAAVINLPSFWTSCTRPSGASRATRRTPPRSRGGAGGGEGGGGRVQGRQRGGRAALVGVMRRRR